MAKARALDRRRKSIRNIRKITRTMELISTARFKRAMDRAIAATRAFYESLGIKTRLSDHPEIQPDAPAVVAQRLTARGVMALGERGDITPAVVEKILTLAV